MPITLVATPLGNLGDLSPRAREILSGADLWLVEDTRVSGKLQFVLEVQIPMKRLDEHTSERAIADFVALAETKNIAVLSDAGTPGISDPGAMLMDRAHEEGVTIDAIPGPSAVPLALSLSGFFAQKFVFLGYMPRKPGDFRRELEPYVTLPHTLVLFESPFRVDKCLAWAGEFLGDRRVTICRELTKAHQQIVRARLLSIPEESQMPRKGEFTIVIEGFRKKKTSG